MRSSASTLDCQPQSSHKRRRQLDLSDQRPQPDQVPSPPHSTPDRPAKRRKTTEAEAWHRRDKKDVRNSACRTSRFWDGLSRVPLVRSALQELEQRDKSERVACPGLDDDPAARTDSNLVVTHDLLQFARHGGPDLTDLRGIPAPGMVPPVGDRHSRNSGGGVRKSQARGRGRGGRGKGTSRSTRSISSYTTQTAKSKSSKTSSPYDAAFKQQLIDWKIYPIDYYHETGNQPPPPENLGEIVAALCGTSRSSLEPEPEARMQEKFLEFRKAYNLATSEEPASRTLDAIEGVKLALSSSHVKRGPVKLTNLLPLLPENFAPGNPDRTYGARPEKLNQSVRRELESFVLPTASRDILCPNFVVHVKGPAGDGSVAKTQATYDGALAARGMEALCAFSDGDCVPRARTITCTFTDGVLRMYAVHIHNRTGCPLLPRLRQMHQQAPSAPKDIEFVTTMIGSWLVQDRLDEFIRGATAFRNGLEWAQRQRDEAITRANESADADQQADAHALSSSLSGEDAGTAARSFTSRSSVDPVSGV